MKKIVGIRTDCVTGEKREVELEWDVVDGKYGKIFQLIGGPTGFEAFYIDFNGKRVVDLDQMKERGWCACMGDVGFKFPRYDRLEISGEEMVKALSEVEQELMETSK
jgi:hypothetical protein